MTESNAYKKLKKQIQEAVELIVLTAHAVPALKGYIKAVEKGGAEKIPDPDYFIKPDAHDRLLSLIPNYRKLLGKFILLSSFSFFEAYVIDVIIELLGFNNETKFLANTLDKKDVESILKKLRENPKKGKLLKYEKLNKELVEAGYRFPSKYINEYGFKKLMNDAKNLRSVKYSRYS